MIRVSEPLVPVPASGRTFTQVRKVRLGDVRPDGSLRFDALIRYAQDVSNDDTTDADLVDDLDWVVRRTTVDVVRDAAFGERLTFTTFCSGLGSCWAERRLRVLGDRGAHLEVASLWVHLDTGSGRPRKLSAQFKDLYGEAAQGRVVRARLLHGSPSDSTPRRHWPVRFVDFDIFDHMNNAAYWAAVEELIAERSFPTWGVRVELEYGHGVDHHSVGGHSVGGHSGGAESRLMLAVTDGLDGDADAGFALWWCTPDRPSPAASGVVSRIDPKRYRS